MYRTLEALEVSVKSRIGKGGLDTSELRSIDAYTTLGNSSCVVVDDPGGETRGSEAANAVRNARVAASNPLSLSIRYNSTEKEAKKERKEEAELKRKEEKWGKKVQGEGSKQLSGSQRKTAHALLLNIEAFCKDKGIETVAMYTLTFEENIGDFREAQRRFNSFATHYIRPVFGEYVCVVELQERGAVHYHLLVGCGMDIQTGFDHEAVKNRDYRSAKPKFRQLWTKTGIAAKKHGFGRDQLRPIEKNAEAAARYLGKYLIKDLTGRDDAEALKGARLVRYSQGFRRVANSQITILSEGSASWRRKLACISYHTGIKHEEMTRNFGQSWAYNLNEIYTNYELWDEGIDGPMAALIVGWLVQAGRSNIVRTRKIEVTQKAA